MQKIIPILFSLITCITNTVLPCYPEEHSFDQKLDIEFDDYYLNYNGYIDQVAMFGNDYDYKDYDGDGLFDRIYRSVSKKYLNGIYTGIYTSYRVDFGNGNKLDIGEFNDIYTSIQLTGTDLTGDSINELIFCGEHIVSTFPRSSSEIAIYQKNDSHYKMMELPRQNDWDKSDMFEFGYDLYKDELTGQKLTVFNTTLNFNEVLLVEDETALDYFSKFSKTQSVASPAWKIEITQYNSLPTIILYNHIGSRYFDKDLRTYLTWKNNHFIPVKTEIK